jgi:excisionase family DNA binding protein
LLKSTRDQDGDAIFTVKTLSDYLHVPTKKIYDMTHLNEIPFLKVGRGLRFRKSEIDSWLQESYTPAVNSISKHFQGRMAK